MISLLAIKNSTKLFLLYLVKTLLKKHRKTFVICYSVLTADEVKFASHHLTQLDVLNFNKLEKKIRS